MVRLFAFALLFGCFPGIWVYSQSSEMPLPLVKIIKNTVSADSNTVIVTYDENFRVSLLEEYISSGGNWHLIQNVKYVRDEKGNVLEISWQGQEGGSNQRILTIGNNRVVFLYDSNGDLSGRRYDSNPKGYTRYDLNEAGLIVREVFIQNETNKIESYWEIKYYESGRISSNKRYLVYNYIPKEDKIINSGNTENYFLAESDYHSFAHPFLVNSQTYVLISPFHKILSYMHNGLPNKNDEYGYNSAGFPSKYILKDDSGKNITEYSIYYTIPPNDFSWDEYLQKKDSPQFIKFTTLEGVPFINPLEGKRKYPLASLNNYPPLDLRNGIPLSPIEILQMEKSYISTNGTGNLEPISISINKYSDYLVSSIRSRSENPLIHKALQIYSINKSHFRIENYSNYPFTIKIGGHRDVFLMPKMGATYSKENVVDSTSFSIHYEDSSYWTRRDFFTEEISRFGGQVDQISKSIDTVLEGTLNRETQFTPLVIWYDMGGSEIGRSEPDPLGDEFKRQMFDILATSVAAYTKEQLESQRKNLESKLLENELLYRASRGEKNDFLFYFEYDNLIQLINLKI